MVCNTKTLSEDGKQEYKYKKVFETLDEAIAEAKKMNAREDHTMKLVGYKCTYCHKYHIGRNGKLIKPKEKAKLKQEFGTTQKTFKVVGWVDLDKLKQKPSERKGFKLVGWIDLDKIKK